MSRTSKYPKIDPIFKAEWVKSLRSGNYKKVNSTLCEIDSETKEPYGYCVLGVACVIAGVPTNKIADQGLPDNSMVRGHENFPVELLTEGKRLSPEGNLADILSDKNDNGQSFKRIATWIEKNL